MCHQEDRIMLRIARIAIILVIFITTSSGAADLFKVTVNSRLDARALSSTGVEGVVSLSDGYLVLVENETTDQLLNSGLDVTSIASNIQKDNLAIDKRMDRQNVARYPLIFEQDGLRLFRVDFVELSSSFKSLELIPILIENMRFDFKEPRHYDKSRLIVAADIDSIIGLIEQDSLESYTGRLQAFFRRLTGTDSNYACADWVKSKLEDFGYDSVFFDDFQHTIYGYPTLCRNVVAVKLGSESPRKHVVVAGHRDAPPDSPGADDNASGTAGVMEIARVMRNIDTKVTLVFIALDAEEQGLYGAWHYSNEAAERGDSIIVMANLDMIGYYPNDYYALLHHGPDPYYALLWADLALPLVNITGYPAGMTPRGDHFPFQQNGYDVVFLFEYYFSSVYHTPRDSTTHLNFDYMTRMVKGMTALVAHLNTDDRDLDGILNLADNCPDDYNPNQADSDDDDVGNLCDNCPDTYNPNQYDENFDGLGDMCDGQIHIITYDPPDGFIDEPYFFQFAAIGGVEPYYWQKWLGQPPTGCIFTGGTEGTVSGTPNWAGISYLSVILTDSDSPSRKDTLGVTFTILGEPEYTCGDADNSEAVDIDDAVFIVNYIFAGGPEPVPYESGDADCSSAVDIDDVVYLLSYIFSGGPAPCDPDGDDIPDC
jgi:hypothetical protein